MSKQEKAKLKQLYVDKCIPNTCSNCASYSSKIEEVERTFGLGTWVKESMMRCTIGGFKVKRMGTCAEWSGKV